MSIRPGITISIQDVDEDFWEQEIQLGRGMFMDEITIEQLYQLFKERYEAEGEEDESEESEDTEEDTEPEGAVPSEPWMRY